MASENHGTETTQEQEAAQELRHEQAAQEQQEMTPAGGIDYEKQIAEHDEKIAALEAQVAEAARNAETAEQLRDDIAELKAQGESDRIGFEQQIWSATDKLRGNIDASEYKNVVLGFIFLKYISDKFNARYQELVDEGEGFEEDRDEYTYKNIFWVPQEARWAEIAGAAHTPERGKVIDNTMRLIEAKNDKLKGILPKNFARQTLDKRRLGEVADLFTNVQMAEKGDTRDILGRTYEYCLSKFAEAEGKNAREFYTPACVVRTLVEIIQPYHGRIYDPCCGKG